MDLKAASDQNSTVDRLTRAGMAICFLASCGLLIGALIFNKLQDDTKLKFPLPVQFTSR
ncbi:protein of unknown function [Hyphomicrobium sp. MC1]|jgi:hypothetical protein|nr:protein of unknown function [Hyphomicrobium sp. MC1]